MRIEQKEKGRTIKTVIVADAAYVEHDDVVEFACEAMGERRENLFNTRVEWLSMGRARVELHTD